MTCFTWQLGCLLVFLLFCTRRAKSRILNWFATLFIDLHFYFTSPGLKTRPFSYISIYSCFHYSTRPSINRRSHRSLQLRVFFSGVLTKQVFVWFTVMLPHIYAIQRSSLRFSLIISPFNKLKRDRWGIIELCISSALHFKKEISISLMSFNNYLSAGFCFYSAASPFKRLKSSTLTHFPLNNNLTFAILFSIDKRERDCMLR